MKRSATPALCCCVLLAVTGVPARIAAATITVDVPGPLETKGKVGCGLFTGAHGFPMEKSVAQAVWLAAQAGGVTCVFRDVADGTYAVSVMLDQNGNERIDTNPMGMPTEAWGVSNNVRPAMRAPRFGEAAFEVSGGRAVEMKVRLVR